VELAAAGIVRMAANYFWQALGLLVLCRILFGGFAGHGAHRSSFRRRMAERWDGMTPEEREKFRQGMRSDAAALERPPAKPRRRTDGAALLHALAVPMTDCAPHRPHSVRFWKLPMERSHESYCLSQLRFARCSYIGRDRKATAGDDEVLIKVRAASVNPLDWHLMRGTPYIGRIAMGLRKPKTTRLGVDVAGQVEALAGM